MAQRHPSWVPLDPSQSSFLSRFHNADLLRRIRVHYAATPLNAVGEWPYQIDIPGAGTAASAQTYGDDVYIREPYRGHHCTQYSLLAHEITHSSQAESLGGLPGFGYQYFRQYARGGRDYYRIGLEIDAERVGDAAGVSCQ